MTTWEWMWTPSRSTTSGPMTENGADLDAGADLGARLDDGGWDGSFVSPLIEAPFA